jgi:hypothetical protein
MLKAVKLKNGTEEFEGLVPVLMAMLRHLADKYPTAFFDLVNQVRDPGYEVFSPGEVGVLVSLGLALEGSTMKKLVVHDSVRNIVLSAVGGNGLEMRLGDPLAPTTEPEAREGE